MQHEHRASAVGLLLGLGLILSACAPAAPPAATQVRAPTKLNVVISGVSGSFSGLFVAAEAGYFADEGLDVPFTSVDSSARAIPVGSPALCWRPAKRGQAARSRRCLRQTT